MGMVFEYLNAPEVWDKFCATYEAIYALIAQFDKEHANTAGIPHNLQDEWHMYIATVLQSMVIRTQATFLRLKFDA